MNRLFVCLLLTAVAAVCIAAEPTPILSTSLDRARQQVAEGKFPEAVTSLDEADKSGGPSGRSLDLRGRIAMEQGQLDEATKLFAEAHAKDAASLGQLHLGDVLLRQKKYSEARDAYRVATKETNILVSYERLRFGILLTYLGEKNDEAAQQALDQIKFPSESGAYYYAQAAWSYSHGQSRDAEKWIKRAEEIYPPKTTSWYARWLYDFGWNKIKPPLSPEQ